MIGMMNVGCDDPENFYSVLRQSSLYPRKTSKESRTYTPEGRVLINGIPENEETADEYWRELIARALVTYKSKENVDGKETWPISLIRRISSKFRTTNKSSSQPIDSTLSPQDLSNFVTLIRVATTNENMRKKKKLVLPEDDEGVLKLLESGGIKEEDSDSHSSDGMCPIMAPPSSRTVIHIGDD